MITVPSDVRVMNLTSAALLLGFVLLCLGAGARALARLPLFDIRSIVVLGDTSHNSAATLRANIAPRLQGSFLSLDLAQARAAFESVPWVRRAEVRRQFPHTLRVRLEEHRAVAYWGNDADGRLLNQHGEIFEANVGEVEQEGLPRLVGPASQAAQVLAMYRLVRSALERLELAVEQVELSGGGSWPIRLDTGAAIELGRGSTEQVQARLERFLGTVTQVAARFGRKGGAVESADLRHDNGYALRLRGVTTATTPLRKP